jgi:hypothetical protein
MAKSNGELVAAAVDMVKLSGREVASVADARALLWPPRVTDAIGPARSAGAIAGGDF